MEKIILKGYKDKEFSFLAYEVENSNTYMCIFHGVAEDATRYDYFARELNKNGINAYVLNEIAHGHDYEINELGSWEKGDFDGCLFNMNVLHKFVKDKHPNFKKVLFGHSMGSFMAQKYELLYPHEFDKTILCGCAYADFLYKIGRLLARTVNLFNKDEKRVKIIDKISFGSFNAKFKPNKTSVDWLSKNTENCIKYEKDPYCGFVCTSRFYREFYENVQIPSKKYNNLLSKDYPMLLIGGSDDMVSGMGKKLIRLYDYYKKQSNNVEYILYQDLRHEILNENEKDTVISDIIKFIGK